MDQNVGAKRFWRAHKERVYLQACGGLRCGLACSRVRHGKVAMSYSNFCNRNFALTIVGGFCHAQAHRLVGQTVDPAQGKGNKNIASSVW